MKFHEYRSEWLEILRKQEEMLRVEKFNAQDAFALGTIMVGLAKEKYQQPISVRIMLGGQTTFSFLMDGTSTHNEWWMDKKLHTCRISGVSSILTLVEVAEGLRPDEPEFDLINDFALCGGCFPLRNTSGKLLGYVLCSGMKHWMDHQLIADALNEYLQADAPAIEG